MAHLLSAITTGQPFGAREIIPSFKTPDGRLQLELGCVWKWTHDHKVNMGENERSGSPILATIRQLHMS
jgi:hypothetical protein